MRRKGEEERMRFLKFVSIINDYDTIGWCKRGDQTSISELSSSKL